MEKQFDAEAPCQTGDIVYGVFYKPSYHGALYSEESSCGGNDILDIIPCQVMDEKWIWENKEKFNSGQIGGYYRTVEEAQAVVSRFCGF